MTLFFEWAVWNSFGKTLLSFPSILMLPVVKGEVSMTGRVELMQIQYRLFQNPGGQVFPAFSMC